MTNKQTGTSGLVERVARALSVPEHHTSWDTLSPFEQARFYIQAEYAIAEMHRLASLSPAPVDEVELIRKAHAEGWEDGWCGATACPPVGFNAEAVEDDWQRSQSLAALTASRPSDDGWMPIETAPKDGRGILLIDMSAEAPEGGQGFWREDCWSAIDPEDDPAGELRTVIWWVEPTHWRPLPDPPAALSSLVGEK